MPNVIKIKNSGTANSAPSSLVAGELAINRADGQLYYLNTSSQIAAITDTIDGGVPSTPAALLLHFDNTTADSSIYARTVTTSGTATTSATQSKFGGYSAFFDGSSSGRIVAADGTTGSLFSFAGDFTVEAWVYLTAFATYRTIVTRYNGSNNAWIMRFEGSGSAVTSLAWYCGAASGSLYNFATSINLNQWYHVAVCRSGASVRAFLNGTQIGTTQTNSSTMTGGSAGCMIGSSNQASFEFPFQGYIDELRIIPQAMYTATFTPNTSAFGQFAGSSARTQTIKFKGSDAATLASVNTTPAVREPVYETDTRCLKVGDGSTAFASLGYVRPYVTATDRLLGRSSAGAGVAEEISCTSDARAILAASNVYAARAWVNFNGTANSSLTGTYSQSGTTVTATVTAHGLTAGQVIYSTPSTGTGVAGVYTVATVTSANVFTYTAGTSLTTSGNVTLNRQTIRASGNVSSVSDNGTGDYTVNFTAALSDANYAAVITIGGTNNALLFRTLEDSTARSTTSLRFACVSVASGFPAIDPAQVSVVVFR